MDTLHRRLFAAAAVRRLGARYRAGHRHHADRPLLRALRRPRGLGRPGDDLPGHRRAAAGADVDRQRRHGDRARRPDRLRRGSSASARPGRAGQRTRSARWTPVSDPADRTRSAGRAGEHHAAAVVAGARPEVDHPVGAADHVEVVLDDDHRQPASTSRSNSPIRRVDVVHVQARWSARRARRCCRSPQLRRQLEPLAFAAGQGRQRLPQRQVAEARRRPARRASWRSPASVKKLGRLADRHLADVAIALPRSLCASTSSVKRLPSQVSQTLTPGPCGRGRCR